MSDTTVASAPAPATIPPELPREGHRKSSAAPAVQPQPQPESEPKLKAEGSPRSQLRQLQDDITAELAANDQAFANRDWQAQLLDALETRDYWKDQYERYRRKYDLLRSKYVFVVERHNNLVVCNVRTRDRLRDLEHEFFSSVLPARHDADDAGDEARVRDYVLDEMRDTVPEQDVLMHV